MEIFDFFLVKKVIGALIMPIPFALCMLFLALLLRAGGRKFLSRLLTVSSLGGLLLLSWPPVSTALITPLENAWPAYRGQPVTYVMVLGGWHEEDERVPVTSVLSSYSTARLLEGIRLWDANKTSKLILSGYPGLNGRISNAQAMKNLALTLGVPEDDILLSPSPRDTREEAIAVKPLVENAPFALVTSASHMKRAMALFRKEGLLPVAAPTDYLAKDNGQSAWGNYLPGANSLRVSERAIYEYAGYTWAKFTDQL